MKDNLTVPKTIRVGFQNRSDTYTGKLAYVIYIDSKGKVRKEQSWKSWIDKKIPSLDFDNTPNSGFVLNRDVGGTRRSYGWDARIEKVRVYDPRDFEFEISIPNLLFILQECSSIKGKGLEGEFVYAWEGPELVLLPVTSPEYTGSMAFTNLQTDKVDKSDVLEGYAYLTKNKQEVVYMGSFVWWGHPALYHWRPKSKVGVKKHVFALLSGDADEGDDDTPTGKTVKRKYTEESDYLLDTGFTKLAKKISSAPVLQYAKIFGKLKASSLVSKPVRLFTKPAGVKSGEEHYYSMYKDVCVERGGYFFTGNFGPEHYSYRNKEIDQKLEIRCDQVVIIQDGKIAPERKELHLGSLTEEDACKMASSLWVELENGAQVELVSCKL